MLSWHERVPDALGHLHGIICGRRNFYQATFMGEKPCRFGWFYEIAADFAKREAATCPCFVPGIVEFLLRRLAFFPRCVVRG